MRAGALAFAMLVLAPSVLPQGAALAQAVVAQDLDRYQRYQHRVRHQKHRAPGLLI